MANKTIQDYHDLQIQLQKYIAQNNFCKINQIMSEIDHLRNQVERVNIVDELTKEQRKEVCHRLIKTLIWTDLTTIPVIFMEKYFKSLGLFDVELLLELNKHLRGLQHVVGTIDHTNASPDEALALTDNYADIVTEIEESPEYVALCDKIENVITERIDFK